MPDQSVDVFLRRTDGRGGRGSVLVIAGRDVEIFELSLEFVHDCRDLVPREPGEPRQRLGKKASRNEKKESRVEGDKTNLLQIHGLHRAIHALDHAHHAPRHLPHGHGGLHPAGNGVDPAAQPQQVQPLVLLPDGVLRVDLGDVRVVLLDGFLELVLLGRFVAAGFDGLAVELFGGELLLKRGLVGWALGGCWRGEGRGGTLRLKRDFSRPDIVMVGFQLDGDGAEVEKDQSDVTGAAGKEEGVE